MARLALSSVLLALSINIVSFAATPSNARRASPSDADKGTLLEDLAILTGLGEIEDGEVDFTDFTADDLLELLLGFVTGPGAAPSQDIPDGDIPEDVIPFEGIEAFSDGEDAASLAISDEDGIVNALRYSVRFNGTDYVLLLPANYVDQVYIDENGYLWNMGTSTISGRLFVGAFNPTATSGDLLYLNPCLGNNFSANNNYGSPNYRRHYYWSSGSLRSTDTYGVVAVIEEPGYPFIQGETLTYIVIILLGGMLLCLWKKSVR